MGVRRNGSQIIRNVAMTVTPIAVNLPMDLDQDEHIAHLPSRYEKKGSAW